MGAADYGVQASINNHIATLIFIAPLLPAGFAKRISRLAQCAPKPLLRFKDVVHDGHLLLYLRYRDSVTGIGENMHGSAQKNANGGAGVAPEGGIWYNAGIIF